MLLTPDLARRWAAGWRTRARPRAAGKALRDIQEDLAGIGPSTEGVFLLLGERLMDLEVRAREIANRTTAFAELLSSDAGSLAVVDRVLTATCASGPGDDLAAAIEGIQENAGSIHQAILAIGPLVRTFDVLAVMTRVESARFESAGATFAGLADAVTALSRQIREQIGTTADSAAQLLETTSRTADQMRQTAQKHRDNLGRLTGQTSAELSRIVDHRQRVSEATKLLAARFEGVSHAVGDVVTALQSHDIVRQQIDHVVEALRRADSAGSSLSGAARLQAAQLDNSRITFENSVGQIRDALAKIDRNIGDMVGESARLLGHSATTEASFFAGVESDLAGILAILDSNVAADRRLAEAVVSVCQRVSEISRTVAGVRAIGFEMQRVALNATIQAALLGAAGGALEIVALAIRALARETETASERLETRLRTLGDIASALGSATAARGGQEAEIAQLRRSAEALRSIQGKAHDDNTRTVDLGVRMKQQIREAADAFGTQDQCLRSLAAAIETLRGLSSGARPSGPDGIAPATSLYTMRSERKVHSALYRQVPPSEVPAAARALPAQGEDNVEFF